ncbi:MAG: nitrite reductase small subunit NirD [Thiobacillus sp.]|nr:nitrite reductase small subunit NirD [Thiobacillus sp.]
MTDWLKICPLDEIPQQGSRVVESKHGRIAVFRANDDEVFALEDRCPHKGGHLSQGIVCGKHVTCPMHGWNIALREGLALAPDVGETAAFPARVEDGVVFIQI